MRTPHFAEAQTIILIVFGVLALGLGGLFAFVAVQTRREVAFEQVRDTGYRLRRAWFAFLVALLLAVVGTSLFHLPYSEGSGPATTIKVIGGQFYWSVSPASVPAGTRVRFDVSAADVNHGMGLYDPDGQLVGSVQAMPGFHNHLERVMSKPGTYVFSCLEYCGLNHARMARTFEVTPR